MRILVTGSRDWHDVYFIHDVLREYIEACDVTLVSGACPRGADIICENFAAHVGWDLELHPPLWDKYGKKAGMVRNSEMVKLGADVCLAFVLNSSKGAMMTASLAKTKGIELRLFRKEEF